MANILITGTSRGIGFEMARIYVAQGHQVLALSRNPSPIDALKLDGLYAFAFDIFSALA